TKLIDTTPNQCPDLAQFQLSYAPSICMGDSTLVTIDYPYSTYTSWSLNGEAFASNKNAIFVSEEGLYTVEVNMNTRCPAGILQVQVNSAQNQSPDTDIVIYPNPDIGIEVGGNTCYGDTITLSTPYQEQYSYNWYSDNKVRIVSDSTSTTQVALHTGNQQVSFDLSVSDNETGCVSLETKQLNIGQKPSNYISTSSMVCQDAQVFLSTGKGTGFSYEWSFSESAYGISTSNNFASVFFAEPDDSTRIDLVVTESFGNCSNHTTRYIQVKNKPDIVLEQAHDSIYITTSNLAYINWFFNDVKMAAAVNKTSIPIESGKYYVEGTTNYGCVGQSDVLTVNLIPLSTINSPLKIYPNPARDNLTIQSKSAPDKIRVVDLNGKNLAQYENTRAIDIKNLKNGIYILLLEIEGEQYQRPFLKE
ncbi:MAG: T9SS type A sorting domain-containing protein, partial [Marinoscillum sp.]